MMSTDSVQPAVPARKMDEENRETDREDMIKTAVKFLQNPKVQASPLAQRRAFLAKKGLTTDEVELALSQAGATEAVQTPVQIAPGALVPVPPPPPVSGWSRARDYAATGIVTAGFAYMLYQMYKRYVVPYLYGPTAEQKQAAALQASVEQLQESVTEMVKGLQESISKQNEKLQEISLRNSQENSYESVNKMQEVHSLSEIKEEIKNLKGLMLAKNQFPSVPQTTPVLEGYQRGSAVTDTSTSVMTTLARTPSVPSWQLKPTNNTDTLTNTSQTSVIPPWQRETTSTDSDMGSVEGKTADSLTSTVTAEEQSEYSTQEVTDSETQQVKSQSEHELSEREQVLLEKSADMETAKSHEEIPTMNGEVPLLDGKIPAADMENPSFEGEPVVEIQTETLNT